VRLLVVNAGSSSLKLHVLGDAEETVAEKSLEWPPDTPFPADALDDVPAVDAVGHRVVHGGEEFREATWIDDEVRERLEALTPLAPLHQPRALAGIDGTAAALPEVAAAACFDTAFHAALAPAAATYALPAEWRERWGLRRFGFHGLSHAYATRHAAELLDRPYESLRIVSCHLGAGASVAAVAGGRSLDTTMGFTPLEGLVMATRAGSVDPGLLLWLQQEAGLDLDDLAEALEHRSGPSDWPAAATCARSSAVTTQRHGSPSTCTSIACALRSPRWPPRSGVSTSSSSPVASASTRRRFELRPRRVCASSGSVSTGSATPPPARMRTSPARLRPCPRSW
jgi:hypothetical protein